MPSDKYMSQYGVSKNEGLCMNMEMPSPGTGGRHRLTSTYGSNMTAKELVSFYTTISNGCKMIDGFNLRKLEEWKFKTGQLNRDFPFTEPWIWEDDENTEKLKYIEDGNIQLIDIGDSQTWNIIVSGKEKGKMWFFTDVGIQPCVPSMNFLTWFEFWLDGNEDYFYDFEN